MMNERIHALAWRVSSRGYGCLVFQWKKKWWYRILWYHFDRCRLGLRRFIFRWRWLFLQGIVRVVKQWWLRIGRSGGREWRVYAGTGLADFLYPIEEYAIQSSSVFRRGEPNMPFQFKLYSSVHGRGKFRGDTVGKEFKFHIDNLACAWINIQACRQLETILCLWIQCGKECLIHDLVALALAPVLERVGKMRI